MTATGSYLKERLAQLHIPASKLKYKIWDHGNDSSRTISLLKSDREDNIQISYLSLEGGIQQYQPSKHKTKDYVVTRLKVPEEDRKYKNPAGQGNRIYHTPGVIEKYQKGEKIKTLYLIEGQFKALAGWYHLGLDICGLTGKDGWKRKQRRLFQEDIKLIIETCEVEKIVLLLDADTRYLDPKKIEEKKDLSHRFWDFHRTVASFSEVASTFKAKAYFVQIHENLKDEAKGLDDLIHHVGEDVAIGQIKKELESVIKTDKDNDFFQGLNLSKSSKKQLKGFFRLNSVNLFYERYMDIIEEQEFVFSKGRYQFDPQEGRVKQLEHPDLHRYIRIGCDYFKKVNIISMLGDEQSVLEPWKKAEISQDYGKDFLKMVPKFDAWCNFPTNNPKEYRQAIQLRDGSTNYNMYQPMTHVPERGGYSNIREFLKHIFSGYHLQSGYDRYFMGLDYLTLLYRHPHQKLPVLILVSEENRTGKSTFVDFLSLIFGSNVAKIGNEDISGDYNAHYASKLVVAIEEGLIEKQKTKEKIKDMATSSTIQYHAKFASKVRVDNIMHIIICSNNETNFMPINEYDERFWVIKVNQIPESKRDVHLLAKMEKEIPAFLEFLQRRELVHKHESRSWFDTKLFDTPELRRVRSSSLPSLQKSIIYLARDYFFEHSTMEMHLTINELIKMTDSSKRDRGYLKKILNENMGIPEPTSPRKKSTPHLIDFRTTGRFYSFYAEDYLTASEIEQIKQAQENPYVEPEEEKERKLVIPQGHLPF